MTKHYFKSDGNGGYNVGKYTLAIISILLVLIGMISTTVFAYGNLNNQVNQLTNNYETAGHIHSKIIDDIEFKNDEQDDVIAEQTTSIAVLNIKLDQIIKILEDLK